ncbi:hypothetical protein ACFV9E_44325, partial [Streptomyces sp. NPDC059835]|uniref:hypothetical protein n=1 Tax=Streptomyces sp. NPDC059835 TaxID=3346967 RepID=UPI00364C85AC
MSETLKKVGSVSMRQNHSGHRAALSVPSVLGGRSTRISSADRMHRQSEPRIGSADQARILRQP